MILKDIILKPINRDLENLLEIETNQIIQEKQKKEVTIIPAPDLSNTSLSKFGKISVLLDIIRHNSKHLCTLIKETHPVKNEY